MTTAFVVPTMLYRILEHPDFPTTDLSSLVSLTYGAAPATPELIRRAMDSLPGVALTNTFGQTETMGSITALGPGDHPPERLASVGKPLPGVEIRIVNPTNGEEAPPGAVGELWVRSDVVVVPEAPAGDGAAPPGWFRTGDMVSADHEGYLYPAGRLSDTINRGGEKFAPAEVEDVVRAHPAVRDVAVFGVPDAEMGQRVGVAVVVQRAARARAAPPVLPGAASPTSNSPSAFWCSPSCPSPTSGSWTARICAPDSPRHDHAVHDTQHDTQHDHEESGATMSYLDDRADLAGRVAVVVGGGGGIGRACAVDLGRAGMHLALCDRDGSCAERGGGDARRCRRRGDDRRARRRGTPTPCRSSSTEPTPVSAPAATSWSTWSAARFDSPSRSRTPGGGTP